jgi:hypothetical protein
MFQMTIRVYLYFILKELHWNRGFCHRLTTFLTDTHHSCFCAGKNELALLLTECWDVLVISFHLQEPIQCQYWLCAFHFQLSICMPGNLVVNTSVIISLLLLILILWTWLYFSFIRFVIVVQVCYHHNPY